MRRPRAGRRTGAIRAGTAVVVALAAALLVAGAPVAAATSAPSTGTGAWSRPSVSVTFDEAAFLAAHPVVATERFDVPREYPHYQRSVWFQAMRFTALRDPRPGWMVEDATSYHIVDAALFAQHGLGFPDGVQTGFDTAVTFARRGAVHSFGFRLRPVASPPHQYVVAVRTADGRMREIFLPQDTTGAYLGLHSRVGIVAVSVLQRPDLVEWGAQSNYAYDDVSRSRVHPWAW